MDLTRRYLAELGTYPLLSAAEEAELAGRIRDGKTAAERLARDPALPPEERARAEAAVRRGSRARTRFVQSNLRLVVSIARRYQAPGMSLLDLIQEGNLGLMRAVEKFDHRKGFKFSTYATWWIRQAIGRGIADKSRTIRLPAHLVDTLASLGRSSAVLLKTLGREPTPQELAAETGLDVAKVETALQAAPDLVSLSAEIGEGGDNVLGDMLPDQNAASPFDIAAAGMERTCLHKLLGHLGERERQILVMRYGLQDEEPLTLDEIGRRFNLTRERIRQIEAKALSKLRHPSSARQRRLVDSLSG